MRILVIDIGGSNVKLAVWGRQRKLKFSSGPSLTARQMVSQTLKLTQDWAYDAVSIGIPGAVVHGKVARTAANLGGGWIGFDFENHFQKRVKIINDAALQALGSYGGGKMLFLGLGTGLGSTLILDDVIVPLELGQLRHSTKYTLGEMLGKEGLNRMGRKAWERIVHHTVERLAAAFHTDYVMLGGGNAQKLHRLPPNARRGDNANAVIGGARLWGQARIQAVPRKHTWVMK